MFHAIKKTKQTNIKTNSCIHLNCREAAISVVYTKTIKIFYFGVEKDLAIKFSEHSLFIFLYLK